MKIRARPFLIIIPTLLLTASSSSYELLSPYHAKWFCDDIPVKYWIDPSGVSSDLVSEVKNGFSHWEGISSSILEFSYEGSTSEGGYDYYDGDNVISFNDPDGDLPYGVLAATSTIMLENYTYTNGTKFYQYFDTDIVFNNGIDFGTSDEAGSYWCTNTYDIESIATHEIGHMIGLDHVSDRDATMYSEIGPCDTSYSSLSDDDMNGIRFIYDEGELPEADFIAEPRRGAAPLNVAFTDLSHPDTEEAMWNFGDHKTSMEIDPTHTYDDPGIYTVTLEVFSSGCYDTMEKKDIIEVLGEGGDGGDRGDGPSCNCTTPGLGGGGRKPSPSPFIFLPSLILTLLLCRQGGHDRGKGSYP